MEERDNTPMLDLNVSLDETMLDNGLDCVPHCDAEKIDEHILYDNGDLVETSKDMTNDYIPKVGMLFESEDELYHFYNYYARRTGFSIRKGHFKWSSDGEIRKRVIYCSKEGFKQRHKRGTPQKEHPVLQTGCMALIQVIAKDGMLAVTKFVEDHNHELVLAEEAHLLRSQKRILPQQARYIESLHSGGCGPTKAFSILSKEHDGPQI
ncbi:hypothetical protein MKW98_005966 [Papaver atlanticum]|uniref:FAR1 domain-containing protein n=1 Tax=Papaver atlanticum TaxID=357466 RepID=A0AAD4S7N0_9MAGN|nr:hypothetical protein MKW98_005966 [Papaver atlanticum]